MKILRTRPVCAVLHALALAAVLGAAPVAAAWAQGQGQSRETTERESATGGQQQGQSDQGKQQPFIAQIGAGTTNSTTTGYSGPKTNKGKKPGENSLQPLPGDDLCKSYQGDKTVYQQCISKVTHH